MSYLDLSIFDQIQEKLDFPCIFSDNHALNDLTELIKGAINSYRSTHGALMLDPKLQQKSTSFSPNMKEQPLRGFPVLV